YSVFRPVIESLITTLRPVFGSAFATIVMLMIRPPNVGELSSVNAGTVGASLFLMLSATFRQSVTLPSFCQSTPHDRRWSSSLLMRHCTHWLPGLRLSAFVWV